MAVNPADVRVGRCFITTGGQVRQVTEITADGKVRYLARGGKWKATWGTGSPLFANASGGIIWAAVFGIGGYFFGEIARCIRLMNS